MTKKLGESLTTTQLLMLLAEVFGQIEVSKPLLNIWTDALKDLSPEQVKEGYHRLIQTRTTNNSPKPAELINALNGSYEEASVLGWNTFFTAFQSNPGRTLQFEDPIIAETIRQLGGLTLLSTMTSKDIQFQRKNFKETYSILARSNRRFDDILVGQHGTPHHGRPIFVESQLKEQKLLESA